MVFTTPKLKNNKKNPKTFKPLPHRLPNKPGSKLKGQIPRRIGTNAKLAPLRPPPTERGTSAAPGSSPAGRPRSAATSRNGGGARPGRLTVRPREAAAAGERPIPLCGDPPARPGRVLHFESLPGAGSGHLSAHATGAGGRGWAPGARHGLLVPPEAAAVCRPCAPGGPGERLPPPPKKPCRDPDQPRPNHPDGKHGRRFPWKPKRTEGFRVPGQAGRPSGVRTRRATARQLGRKPSTRPRGAPGESAGLEPPTRSRPEIRGPEPRTGAPGRGGGTGPRGRGPLPEAGPAEATPGTHLCSGGKPVAKKNVRQDYGTYIRRCPHPRGTGRSQRTTAFPSAPRARAGPPPAVRGPWARCARPAEEHTSPRACSCRRR